MASRTVVFRTVLIEAWRPLPGKTASFSIPTHKISAPNLSCGCSSIIPKTQNFHIESRSLNCFNNENPSSSSDDRQTKGLPKKLFSRLFQAEGRVGQTTNVVMGGTVTDDSTNEWLALDKKVNSYPTVRGFTAIGTGGDDFVQAMVVAVESVLHQPIPEAQVKQKLSSGGKYVSVNIGPVQVVSSEQVQAVYNAMRRDDRMKYFV